MSFSTPHLGPQEEKKSQSWVRYASLRNSGDLAPKLDWVFIIIIFSPPKKETVLPTKSKLEHPLRAGTNAAVPVPSHGYARMLQPCTDGQMLSGPIQTLLQQKCLSGAEQICDSEGTPLFEGGGTKGEGAHSHARTFCTRKKKKKQNHEKMGIVMEMADFPQDLGDSERDGSSLLVHPDIIASIHPLHGLKQNTQVGFFFFSSDKLLEAKKR